MATDSSAKIARYSERDFKNIHPARCKKSTGLFYECNEIRKFLPERRHPTRPINKPSKRHINEPTPTLPDQDVIRPLAVLLNS